MKRVLRALVIVVLSSQAVHARTLHASWIDPQALDLARVLPPPPAPDSPEQRADMAAIRAAVAARTPEDERRIAANLPCTLDQFTDTLGPDFTAARMPVTAALITRVFQDGELAVSAAKAVIARPRPYTLDPTLATFGHRSGSTSYPSGHATFGHLAATVLGAMVPERRGALFARADAYGRNRLVAGTHFPSDLEAGKVAAAVIAEALFREAGFRDALEEARAEVQRVTAAH